MKLFLGTLLAAAAMQASGYSLPDDDVQFSGPDADLLNGNCTACHSAEMVLLQPKMTAEQWGHSVAKMRTVYKAPISDEDAAALPAALVRATGR